MKTSFDNTHFVVGNRKYADKVAANDFASYVGTRAVFDVGRDAEFYGILGAVPCVVPERDVAD